MERDLLPSRLGTRLSARRLPRTAPTVVLCFPRGSGLARSPAAAMVKGFERPTGGTCASAAESPDAVVSRGQIPAGGNPRGEKTAWQSLKIQRSS